MPLSKEEVYGTLSDNNGTVFELSQAQFEDLRNRLKVIQGGKPDPLLSTGQAAEIIGVSRRTLTRILDEGGIPFTRYGNGHRRLRMSDALRFRDEEAARRREALEDMRELYSDGGFDDLDFIDSYLKQFD